MGDPIGDPLTQRLTAASNAADQADWVVDTVPLFSPASIMESVGRD